MTKATFKENLEKGQEWENKFLNILEKKLPSTTNVIDNRKFYRDKDNRKVPDFTLVDSVANKTVYYDAKSKSWYKTKTSKGELKELFTMDSSFVDSYRSLAEETGSKVYIAFWDKAKDHDHFYVLDVMEPEYDTYLYQNEYTVDNRPAYRWDRNKMIKRKMEL